MKSKHLRRALEQLAEEGVTRIFKPLVGGDWIVGVVGALQLDVLAERLKSEYGLPIAYETPRFALCRWVASGDRNELERFWSANRSAMATDLDGAPVFLAPSPFYLQYEQERWPKIRFADVKDYQQRASRLIVAR